MSWKKVSTRCRTGKHEYVASHQLLECNDGYQAFVETDNTAYSVMLYCGYVTTITLNVGGISFEVNAPYANNASSGSQPTGAAADWYIMNAAFAYATKQMALGPIIPDMTGRLPMGRGTNNDAGPRYTSYGSIDISNGIVPGHTHLTTWDGSNANLYLDLRHFHTMPAIYTLGDKDFEPDEPVEPGTYPNWDPPLYMPPTQKITGCQNQINPKDVMYNHCSHGGIPAPVDPAHSIVYAMKGTDDKSQPDGVVPGGGSWNSNDGLGLVGSGLLENEVGPSKKIGDLSTQPTPINDPANAGATSEPLYARSWRSYTMPATPETQAWEPGLPPLGWDINDIIDNSNALFIQNLGGDVPAIDSSAYYCTTLSDGSGINPLLLNESTSEQEKEQESASEVDITKNGYKCFGMYYIIYYPLNLT